VSLGAMVSLDLTSHDAALPSYGDTERAYARRGKHTGDDGLAPQYSHIVRSPSSRSLQAQLREGDVSNDFEDIPDDYYHYAFPDPSDADSLSQDERLSDDQMSEQEVRQDRSEDAIEDPRFNQGIWWMC
jgi:hypothetical protein